MMSYLNEAKELYNKTNYESYLELLYENSSVAKKYIWSLIILSITLFGISLYLDYLIINGTIEGNIAFAVAVAVAFALGAVAFAIMLEKPIQKWICKRIIEKEEEHSLLFTLSIDVQMLINEVELIKKQISSKSRRKMR